MHVYVCIYSVCVSVCLYTRMTYMLNIIIVSSPGVGTLRPEDPLKYDEGYPSHHAIVLPGQDQRQGRTLLAGLPPWLLLFVSSFLPGLVCFFFLRPVFSSPHTTFGFGSYPFFLTSLFPSPFRFLPFSFSSHIPFYPPSSHHGLPSFSSPWLLPTPSPFPFLLFLFLPCSFCILPVSILCFSRYHGCPR